MGSSLTPSTARYASISATPYAGPHAATPDVAPRAPFLEDSDSSPVVANAAQPSATPSATR